MLSKISDQDLGERVGLRAAVKFLEGYANNKFCCLPQLSSQALVA